MLSVVLLVAMIVLMKEFEEKEIGTPGSQCSKPKKILSGRET